MGVVNESMDDAELERLLTQLLRVLSPAPAGEPPVPARPAGRTVAGVHSAGGRADGGHAEAPGAQAAANGGAVAGGDSPDAAVEVGDPLAGDQAALPAVSSSEARALIELVSARGIAQGELAGLLGLEKSTVSRLAAGLERKGWIRRGRDEGNQRYVRLYLTPEGRGVAARLWAAWQSTQARILGALSAEERAGLSAGLRGLVRGLAAEGLLSETPGHD